MRRTPSVNALRLFRLVARNRSFSETARIANLSQPALSRTIRLLEEDMGARLFDRDTRNVAPTAAGEALLPVAEKLLDDFDSAFAELAHDFAGTRGRVLLGCFPSFAASVLPPLLAGFLADRPNIDVTLRENLSDTLYRQMKERALDLAVVTPPENNGEAFLFAPLFVDPCVLICRAGDELDMPTPAPWDVLGANRFIAMAHGSSVRELTDRALAQAGVTVRPLFECTQLATVGGLVAAGLGVTVLPASTLPMLQAHQVVSRPLLPPEAARTIGLVRLAERSLSPPAQALHDFLSAQSDLCKKLLKI